MTLYDEIQYKKYGFKDGVGLINKEDQLIGQLTGSINSISRDVQHAVSDGMKFIGHDFFKVHNHIERAKNEINHHTTISQPCICHLATKQDVRNAVDELSIKSERNTSEVKTKIDDAVVELKRNSQDLKNAVLSDLNQMAEEMTVRIDTGFHDVTQRVIAESTNLGLEVKTAKYEVKNALETKTEEVKRYINSKTVEQRDYMATEFGDLNQQVRGLYDINYSDYGEYNG